MVGVLIGDWHGGGTVAVRGDGLVWAADRGQGVHDVSECVSAAVVACSEPPTLEIDTADARLRQSVPEMSTS